MWLRAQGFGFSILPQAFLVHIPHVESKVGHLFFVFEYLNFRLVAKGLVVGRHGSIYVSQFYRSAGEGLMERRR